MRNPKMTLLMSCLLAYWLLGGNVFGMEDFPKKPLELVVPFAPGGGTDVMCRTMVAEAASFLKNRPIVVVNKMGSATVAASKYVLDGRNDGYTLYLSSISSMMITPLIQKTNYSWRDFIGIAQVFRGGDAFFVRADFPYNTMEKFIEYAKQNPGAIKYATAGTGTGTHLAIEGFAAAVGINIKHIPTKGDSEALAAILGGHVVAASAGLSVFMPHVELGKLKCLAQWGVMRDKLFPQVPTFKDQGIDTAVDLWRWVVVPKGVPEDRIKILATAFKAILQDKGTIARMEKVRNPVSYLPPEEYKNVMEESEIAIVRLVKVAGIVKD